MDHMSWGIGLMPEQVWEDPDIPAAPYGSNPATASIGFIDGKAAGSATPLIWAEGQYVRLIRDLQTGTLTDQPAITKDRYVTSRSANKRSRHDQLSNERCDRERLHNRNRHDCARGPGCDLYGPNGIRNRQHHPRADLGAQRPVLSDRADTARQRRDHRRVQRRLALVGIRAGDRDRRLVPTCRP